jgi:NADH:ubiquinone oxidoreductase subunit H
LDFVIFIVIFLLLAICVLVGVAFRVHLERRVLGYVHICKGPNRVGFISLFQPFSDAIKLFTREQYFPLVSNYLILCCNTGSSIELTITKLVKLLVTATSNTDHHKTVSNSYRQH